MQEEKEDQATPKRLVSLDVFRGATIAAMIMVNNPGTWQYVYPPLKHAEWHGWTFTDLIFPFFLFIVGVGLLVILIDDDLPDGLYEILNAPLFAFDEGGDPLGFCFQGRYKYHKGGIEFDFILITDTLF